MKDTIQSILYLVGSIVILAFFIFHIWVGFLGVDYYFGPLWATIAVIIFLLLSSFFPIFASFFIIAGFLGMVNVLDLHWGIALGIIHVPILFLIFPATCFAVFEAIASKFSKNDNSF